MYQATRRLIEIALAAVRDASAQAASTDTPKPSSAGADGAQARLACWRARSIAPGLAGLLVALSVSPGTAQTMTPPCGSQISFTAGQSVTVELQKCNYPQLAIFIANQTDPATQVVVEGNGATIDYSAAGVSTVRAFAGQITVRDLTITGGNSPVSGGFGGIDAAGNVTFERVRITGNTGTLGGGIHVQYESNLALIDSTISNNTAQLGGGIYFEHPGGSSRLQLVRTTVSGNRATLTVDTNRLPGGGGIYLDAGGPGVPGNMLVFQMDNSTLSGNSASLGGGIAMTGFVAAQISNSTISSNSAGDGGAIYDFGITLGMALRNTIIADNSSVSGYSCSGFYGDTGGDGGYNAFSPDCAISTPPPSPPGTLIVQPGALKLGPLADNGGPTQTHLPLAGSPVLDAIPLGVSWCGTDPATDQRGVARPQGLGCDIGAVEVAAVPPVGWSGVLPPIKADGSSVFKLGSVVPVQFQLTGASAGRTDLVARLSYTKLSDGVAGPVNSADAPGNSTPGNQFKYDPVTGFYVFNWSTKGLTAGTYELIIDLGDGFARTINLGLR